MTVVGPHNNWVVVKVGPEHIKLVKLRDRITISYADEVAVALRKLNEAPPADQIEADETGDMNMNAPAVEEQDWVEATLTGATDLTTIEITDTIAAIDRGNRTITFAGTGGKTRTIKVSPAVQGFNQVEVGDMWSCWRSLAPWLSTSSPSEACLRQRRRGRQERGSDVRFGSKADVVFMERVSPLSANSGPAKHARKCC